MKKESWSDLMMLLSLLALIFGIVAVMGVSFLLTFGQWATLAILLVVYGIYFKMKN